VPSSTAKEKKSKAVSLETPLQFIKGVGPVRASAFSRKDVITVNDAIYYFPRRYEDRRRICSPIDLAAFPDGSQVTVLARIENLREVPLRGRKQKLLELTAMGEKADLLSCTWFHVYKGMKEKLPIGSWAIFTGAIKKYRGTSQITHPDVEILKEKPDAKLTESLFGKSLHWGRITPIYSRSDKLSQKLIREVINTSLEQGLPLVEEILPAPLRKKYDLLEIRSALQEMHFPKKIAPLTEALTTENLHPAVRRLIFEEFFKFQLVLLMDRSQMKQEPAQAFHIRGSLFPKMRKNLPYTLTHAQERAIADVLKDLQKEVAMNRIVQGDVGSGKTMVALFALAEAAENNLQGALMAPTEILAEQHYANALKLFAGTEVTIGFLTGSLSRAEKVAAQEKIQNGEWKIVIGTHALIQEAVNWKNLAFVVIDEQHRFGVRQRTFLKEKSLPGKAPHILTMTATPIPRSLALTIFGELAVSSIDELPPGRQEIITKVLRGKDRDRLYGLIRKEAEAGRQSYIVYPLVSDSDKEGMERLKSAESEFERLQSTHLAGLRLALVHGQMKSEERNEVMRAFKEKKYDVLISTTVIEVGVDVPNATVMAIENSERFGLSQLHQLRGRVGRGEHKSYCVMVTDSPPPGMIRKTESLEEGIDDESPWTRLLILEKSRDGFAIAEEDLKIRGPGDFFGTKQSGSPSFRLADLSRDARLLEIARQEAQDIYQNDPKLEKPENMGLKKFFHTVMEEASVTLKSG